MKKKLTFLMFGLLLAVGWTSSAQAQKLAKPTIPENLRHSVQKESATSRIPNAFGANGSMRAPQRTPNTITADEVRTGEWWSSKTYTWYDSYPSSGTGHTASFTEPATDPYQMMYMVREIYTNPLYPGIQYDEVYQSATPYPGIGYGWDIQGDFDINNIEIILYNTYTYVAAIIVTDENDNELTEWYSDDNLPSGWSSSGTLRTTTYNDGTNNFYASYIYNGGTITIPKSLFSSASTIYIYVYAVNGSNSTNYIGVNGLYATLTNSWAPYSLSYTSEIANPPSYNGYTVMLVKVKDDATDFPYSTSTSQELIDGCFSKYESIELLTDGLRVGEGTSNAGTVFAYTGDLNRFFFIGKGKTAQFSVVAPFYEMYEEFSPTTVDEGAEITDFYEKMKQGETYNIIHDCQSVSQMEHYFSMSGKAGTAEHRVNSLVLYIPDDRSTPPADGYVSREYDHQPTVGIYMVDLYADIEPSSTPDYYTVTVEWFDNLSELTQDNVPQTYTLYEITYNEQTGQNDTVPVYTGPATTWTHDYPVGDPTAYDIHYFVIATPTNATNQDTFFAKSNTDNVTVPGTTDFIGLQWWRYESDYVTNDGTNHEVNYYRNFLAPHALNSSNQAGISAGNVGANGRTLTLYREDIPVIDLELVMSGNKCYYRIKYRDAQNNQQIEPGYNENGELNTNN